MSTDGFWTSIANSPASRIARMRLDVSRSALVGMQPRKMQRPPSSLAPSITATLRPRPEDFFAAAYPPLPPPITMTSYSSDMSGNFVGCPQKDKLSFLAFEVTVLTSKIGADRSRPNPSHCDVLSEGRKPVLDVLKKFGDLI